MAVRLKPLQQHVIVITGASSGIGLCTALRAAEKGARVVLAARSDAALDAIVVQIGAAGGQAIAVPTDVGDRAQLQALADAGMIVASPRAILEAATEGGRDIKVGAMAKMNTTMAKLLPSLGNKMAAMQADRQQRDMPARAPEGSLFRPSGGGSVYGRAPHEGRGAAQPDHHLAAVQWPVRIPCGRQVERPSGLMNVRARAHAGKGLAQGEDACPGEVFGFATGSRWRAS